MERGGKRSEVSVRGTVRPIRAASLQGECLSELPRKLIRCGEKLPTGLIDLEVLVASIRAVVEETWRQ